MKKSILIAMFLGIVGMLAQAGVIEKMVARVNSEAVFYSEFEKNLTAVLAMQGQSMPEKDQTEAWKKEQRKAVLDQMIDDKILLQETKKRKIKINKRDLEEGTKQIKARFNKDEEGNDVSPLVADKNFREELKKEGLTEKAFLDRVQEQLGVVKLIDEEVKAKIENPTESELKDTFNTVTKIIGGQKIKDMNRDDAVQFEALAKYFENSTTERIRASHILVKVDKDASLKDKSEARKKIGMVQTKIKQGDDFSELAKKYSDDKESALRGGNLGFFVRGMMVPAFEKAAFKLNVGDVSDIVETEFGYHIIKLDEKKAPTKLKFDDVKQELGEFTFRIKAKKRYDLWMSSLRKSATIEILDADLK